MLKKDNTFYQLDNAFKIQRMQYKWIFYAENAKKSTHSDSHKIVVDQKKTLENFVSGFVSTPSNKILFTFICFTVKWIDKNWIDAVKK